MASVDPRTVASPKSRVGAVEVLHAGGEGEWSLARLIWDGGPRLGLRWNGDASNPIGSPQSRGLPTWFIVPEALEDAVEDAAREQRSPLDAEYEEMARDEAGQAEAEEWSEGLIGDAAGTPDEAW